MNITEVMTMIFQRFPDFLPYWQQARDGEYWDDFEQSIAQFSIFSHYSIDLLVDINTSPALISQLFVVAEDCLQYGDDQVKTGITTCYLENIMNVTPEKIDPARYISFLGQQSRRFCQAWDAWTGVRTKGLW